MSWGTKIILAFVLFALFLGGLVYRAYQSKVHLVAPDYYQQELAFQQKIDKIENERALDQSVLIEHQSQSKELLIRFPADFPVKSAHLALYRPADASLDRQWQLQLDQDNTQLLSTRDLASGLWQAKLEWRDDQKAYFKEQNIYLP